MRRGLLALDVGADAAFDALDANGDGRIDRAELAAGMRRLGQNVDDAGLDAMFAEVRCTTTTTNTNSNNTNTNTNNNIIRW